MKYHANNMRRIKTFLSSYYSISKILSRKSSLYRQLTQNPSTELSKQITNHWENKIHPLSLEDE